MNKLVLRLFLYLSTSNLIYAQKVFFCDSVYIESRQCFESTCEYYYNFYSEKKDSILKATFKEDIVVPQKIKILANATKNKVLNGYVFGITERDTIFKITYNNGVANGIFKLFNEGRTLCSLPIVNGKKHGIQIFYPEKDTSTYLIQRFENGIADGPFIETSKNKIVYFCNYKSGYKNGAEYQLFDTGELEWCLANEKGKVKDGTYYRFNVEGNVIEQIKVKNGKTKKNIKRR
jgi:antitoxin component YwqK of YwqJK toxin-antitoxin module